MADMIERLKSERDGAVERGLVMLEAKNYWMERARVAEAALAEAKRLLKVFARIADGEPDTPDGASTVVNISRCRDAVRFLSQEPNHER